MIARPEPHPPATAAGHAPEPEPALRARFASGETSAVEALVLGFYGDVRRYALTILMDGDAADDAVQETFLRIVEQHRRFDPARPFRPWLFTVCRHCCLEAQRRRRREGARILELEPEENAGDLLERQPDAQESVLARLLREEGEAAALLALSQLGEPAREIIHLHLFEGMTFREIGELLAVPQNSAATWYYRGLRVLRSRLDDGRTHGGTNR